MRVEIVNHGQLVHVVVGKHRVEIVFVGVGVVVDPPVQYLKQSQLK
tara:strand:- start:1196 stop:1333 length:138 start_codon:yes stop_codon:yes gene_type:complete